MAFAGAVVVRGGSNGGAADAWITRRIPKQKRRLRSTCVLFNFAGFVRTENNFSDFKASKNVILRMPLQDGLFIIKSAEVIEFQFFLLVPIHFTFCFWSSTLMFLH